MTPQNNPPQTVKVPVAREPLSWLFAAFFADGHVITQNPDDKPIEQPEGSAFTDVIGYEHTSPLIAFELRHVDGDKVVTVDLKTGNFVVNGVPVCAHNQYFEPHKYPLKLVYFRETRIDRDIKATVMEDGSIKEEPTGEPRHYVNRYFLGWETVVNGKNKQTTLAVG